MQEVKYSWRQVVSKVGLIRGYNQHYNPYLVNYFLSAGCSFGAGYIYENTEVPNASTYMHKHSMIIKKAIYQTVILHIMIIYMRKHFSRKPKLSKLPWRLTLKNFRVSFYFLDPWGDFHKISFTHAIWSSRSKPWWYTVHYSV